MSKDWVKDIKEMHEKFGVYEAMSDMDIETLIKFIVFRGKCLEEEINEYKNAKTPADLVDALMDIAVFSLSTIDCFNVDAYKAWDEVLKANLSKFPGIKSSRPNPFGLPDLIKPDNFIDPDHSDNIGIIPSWTN